eukprot:6176498-Pleurochrysis_carterae.AAC.1
MAISPALKPTVPFAPPFRVKRAARHCTALSEGVGTRTEYYSDKIRMCNLSIPAREKVSALSACVSHSSLYSCSATA